MDKWKQKFESSDVGKLFNKGREVLGQTGPQNAREAQNRPKVSQPMMTRQPSNQSQPPPIPTASKPTSTRQSGQPVKPKLKGEPKLLGLVGDPGLNRDSGGSTRFGNRVLWTYRDTQICKADGSIQMLPIISSTASWSDYGKHGGPDVQICRGDPFKTNVLRQYGKHPENRSFFYSLPHICEEPAGNCGDNARVALWPDQPPLVTQETQDGKITAYTWIKKAHIGHDLSVKTEFPGTMLYRLDYHPSHRPGSHNDLPKVSIVAENFWHQGTLSFGTHGNFIKDGIVYLYAREKNQTSLARVPAGEVENREAYEFWVHGQWRKEMPQIGQDGIHLHNSDAGGQGTFMWNEHWQSYVWIGGDTFPGARVHITTAPEPWGPWEQPEIFYTGPPGNNFLGAYSVQAHPSLATDPHKNEMYLTYTKQDDVYTTPLVYVEFE